MNDERAQSVDPGALDPAAVPASAAGVLNIANLLTLLRLALVPVFAVFLFVDDGESDAWRVAAAAVFAVASITDRIDGDIARSRGSSPSSARSPTPSPTRRSSGRRSSGCRSSATCRGG